MSISSRTRLIGRTVPWAVTQKEGPRSGRRGKSEAAVSIGVGIGIELERKWDGTGAPMMDVGKPDGYCAAIDVDTVRARSDRQDDAIDRMVRTFARMVDRTIPDAGTADVSVGAGLRTAAVFLREALLFGNPRIFTDQLPLLRSSGGSRREWGERELMLLFDAFARYFPKSVHADLEAIRSASRRVMDAGPDASKPYVVEGGLLGSESVALLAALRERREIDARNIVEKVLERGIAPAAVFDHLLRPVQYEIGRLWQMGLLSVEEEHYATDTVQAIVTGIVERAAPEVHDRSPVVIGAVVGEERHNVGIRMIVGELRLQGIPSLYVDGVGSADTLIDEVQTWSPRVVALSVTMPYHLPDARSWIDALRKAPGVEQPNIIVGGRAFESSADAWREIGADGYATDVREAGTAVRRFLDGRDGQR